MTGRDIWTALIGTLLLTSLVLSCSPKPVEVIESYQQANNGHDLDKLMSLYAEDVTFKVPETFALQGREQLRDLAEYDFALDVHMSCSQFTSRGDSVMCQLTETNDWLRTAGIEKAQYSMTFVVGGGLIRSITAEPDPTTIRAYRLVWMSLLTWAKEESPELAKEMMPEGQFIYNAQNARHLLSLLREWKQVQRRQELKPAWRKLGE